MEPLRPSSFKYRQENGKLNFTVEYLSFFFVPMKLQILVVNLRGD